MSSKPDWPTKWVPGHPGLHRGILSWKTKTKKTARKKELITQSRLILNSQRIVFSAFWVLGSKVPTPSSGSGLLVLSSLYLIFLGESHYCVHSNKVFSHWNTQVSVHSKVIWNFMRAESNEFCRSSQLFQIFAFTSVLRVPQYMRLLTSSLVLSVMNNSLYQAASLQILESLWRATTSSPWKSWVPLSFAVCLGLNFPENCIFFNLICCVWILDCPWF